MTIHIKTQPPLPSEQAGTEHVNHANHANHQAHPDQGRTLEPMNMVLSMPRKQSERSCWWAGAIAIGATLLGTAPAQAQVGEVRLPSLPGLDFQTSAPLVCAGIGDWYTTNGGDGAGDIPDCDTTILDFRGTPPFHSFFINISPTDLAAAGGSVQIRVEDAESGGTRDEVRGASAADDNVPENTDPTRFTLRNSGNQVLQTFTVPSGSPDGTILTFNPITEPGVYILTSETGGLVIGGGAPNPAAPERNTDDNSFTIVVTGITTLLVGQFQGTFQRNFGPAATDLDLFFLVGPGTESLRLRNFDLDDSVAAPIRTVTYTSPTGAVIPGTSSGATVWNGGGDINTGEDAIAGLDTIADAGTWSILLTNYNLENQTLFEANSGDQRLPLFDAPPQAAGNFLITPDTTLETDIGNPVDHQFTVTNNFFTTDIVNLSLGGTDANYTVELIDPATGQPLIDTDGDGNLDTGILDPGESQQFILRVTPNEGAPPEDNTVITGVSFMDARVREEGSVPIAQEVTKTTLIEADLPSGADVSLYKRITRVVRSATGVVETYNDVITPPGITDFTGALSPNPALLQSGDLVEYTLYYINESGIGVTAAEICDPLPPGTTFVDNPATVPAFQNLYQPGRGIAVTGPAPLPLGTGSALTNAIDGDAGAFLSPLAPNLACPGENAGSQGAVVVQVGGVENNQAGFVKFVVRVN